MIEQNGMQDETLNRAAEWLLQAVAWLLDAVRPLADTLGWRPSSVIFAAGALVLFCIIVKNLIWRTPSQLIASALRRNEQLEFEVRRLETRVRELENGMVKAGAQAEVAAGRIVALTQRIEQMREFEVSVLRMEARSEYAEEKMRWVLQGIERASESNNFPKKNLLGNTQSKFM